MPVRKYRFSEELLRELQMAYAGKKSAITPALDRLVRKTGWPRHAFLYEARRRGWITADHRRAWTHCEVEYLRDRLGVVSAKQIARNLKRSVESVEAKAERLHLSRRIREGYTMTDLAVVFGESAHRVRRWMERGLLGMPHRNGNEVRVKEQHVIAFVRRHAWEYDLRRVDQAWFKSVVFGSLAEYGERL